MGGSHMCDGRSWGMSYSGVVWNSDFLFYTDTFSFFPPSPSVKDF